MLYGHGELGKRKSQESCTLFAHDNTSMESFRKKKISKCIIISIEKENTRETKNSILEEVIQKIVVSIANQNKEFALFRELRETEFSEKMEQRESKKNKIKDLHPVLNMLQNVSATNSEIKPDDLLGSCKAYFNIKISRPS